MDVVETGTADWNLQCLTVGPLMMNAWLLWSPAAGEAALIDPGDDPDVLLGAVEATGCRLTHLLATHGHFDHVSAAADVQKEWDLPLQRHPGDAFLIDGLNATRSMYGFPPCEEPKVADLDAAPLPFAGATLDVRHAPGHCPGHLLFVFGSHAVVGDVIFHDSIGRTDLPGGDFDTLAASIRSEVYSLPDSTTLHPGHGPDTTVARERASNPFVRP